MGWDGEIPSVGPSLVLEVRRVGWVGVPRVLDVGVLRSFAVLEVPHRRDLYLVPFRRIRVDGRRGEGVGGPCELPGPREEDGGRFGWGEGEGGRRGGVGVEVGARGQGVGVNYFEVVPVGKGGGEGTGGHGDGGCRCRDGVGLTGGLLPQGGGGPPLPVAAGAGQ